MTKIDDNTFKEILKMTKTHKKNISKKIATKFSILLSKLINYSSIFCDNCNHKTVFTQDIDAALLTLGIGK